MSTILVTGGAGFLGSNLCNKLVKTGENIICLDNLYTGRMKNIESLFQHSNFSFIQHDIIEPIDIKVDKIYNMACPASPPAYQKDPINTIRTSVIGIMNMLELARKYNASILQTSTSEVYGEPEIHPQIEEYRGNVNPIGIRSCYDESKRLAETLMFEYHRQYGLNTKVVRLFNSYGLNMSPDDGRVVSNFINQALRDEDITIYGDGSQTRSLCYVDDTIEAIYRMMETDGVTGPINIGNPEEYSVKEIADTILKLCNSHSRITYQDLPSDDPTKRKPDISKAKILLKWEPTTSLKSGLLKTIEYYEKENK